MLYTVQQCLCVYTDAIVTRVNTSCNAISHMTLAYIAFISRVFPEYMRMCACAYFAFNFVREFSSVLFLLVYFIHSHVAELTESHYKYFFCRFIEDNNVRLLRIKVSNVQILFCMSLINPSNHSSIHSFGFSYYLDGELNACTCGIGAVYDCKREYVHADRT
jgi:hypothetical protein